MSANLEKIEYVMQIFCLKTHGYTVCISSICHEIIGNSDTKFAFKMACKYFLSVFVNKIAYPHTFFDKNVSYRYFYKVCGLNYSENRENGQRGKAAQQSRRRYGNDPCEHAVEQKRDKRFAPASQGEVQRVEKSLKRKEQCRYNNKEGRIAPHFLCGIIKAWENSCD